MSDYPTGLSRFFQPPPPRPTPDLRLNRIADALERIANVVDPPPRDEDTWQQRSIWEEFAAVVMFELPRIGYALGVLSDTDPKTLLERAAAQAEAPDMSAALEAEYQRGYSAGHMVGQTEVLDRIRSGEKDGTLWGVIDWLDANTDGGEA